MKKSLILTACAMLLALTGCSTYQYSARQTSIVRHDIQATPTVADVHADYNRRIETSSQWHKNREDAVNECRYLALTQNKIGVVVDPIFKIEYRPLKLRPFKASMTGFAGYFVNPRTFTEDMEATKNYSREEIENYKLLTDPEFPQHFYLPSETENYLIHSNDAVKSEESASKSVMLRPKKERAPKKVKQYDYHKSLQLRNAGIGLLCAGVACVAGGLGMCFGSNPIYEKGWEMRNNGNRLGNEEMRREGDRLQSMANILEVSGLTVITVGTGMGIAGIPMIAVGAVRVNKARKMDITLNAGGNGIGVGLTF